MTRAMTMTDDDDDDEGEDEEDEPGVEGAVQSPVCAG